MRSQQVQMPFAQISKYSLRLDLGSITMIPPAGPECAFARSLDCLTNGGHLSGRSDMDFLYQAE
jgi:hypothetical protein